MLQSPKVDWLSWVYGVTLPSFQSTVELLIKIRKHHPPSNPNDHINLSILLYIIQFQYNLPGNTVKADTVGTTNGTKTQFIENKKLF